MNVLIITGNLGRDAETRFTAAGKAVCGFSIPMKSGFGEYEKITWVRCNLWGKRAEGGLPALLVKGQMVAVHGEASLNEWQDNEGNNHASIELNVSDLTLCGRPRNASEQGGNTLADLNKEAGGHSTKQNSDPFADSPDFGDVPVDDDIPF